MKCSGLLVVIVFTYSLRMSSAQSLEVDSENAQSYAMSIAKMDDLLEFCDDLVLNLQYYTDDLEVRLQFIRRAVDEMRDRHKKAEDDLEAFYSNPVHSFALIRRMQSDWAHWQVFMENSVGFEQLSYMQSIQSFLPTSRDFQDAAAGVRRIQQDYSLEPLDMAQGLLAGVQYNATLTPVDCIALAHYYQSGNYFYEAEQWMRAAVLSFKQSDYPSELTKLRKLQLGDIYDGLVKVLQKQNKHAEALETLDWSLQLSPNNAKLLKAQQAERNKMLLQLQPLKSEQESNLYQCCSGECQKPSRLYCLYNKTTSPYLRLAPLKMELLSLNPYVVLYHDIISPADRSFLRQVSKEHLLPSRTTADSKQGVVTQNRTAKSVWYEWNANEVVSRMEVMVGDMTGFDTNSSEQFQVINYGVGGLFNEHSDVLSRQDEWDGLRIATVLFFLSEVAQGGATLFTHLDLAVFPQPGAALFWHNLDKTGELNVRANHAGCPVIVGSKWIMSKWLHAGGQEFITPCYD